MSVAHNSRRVQLRAGPTAGQRSSGEKLREESALTCAAKEREGKWPEEENEMNRRRDGEARRHVFRAYRFPRASGPPRERESVVNLRERRTIIHLHSLAIRAATTSRRL